MVITGKAAASQLARNGCAVFGTSWKPDKCNPDGYKTPRLDVCSEDSVIPDEQAFPFTGRKNAKERYLGKVLREIVYDLE